LKAGEVLSVDRRAVIARFARHRKIHSIWRSLTGGYISRNR
jgi:hypothetical protein